MNTLALCHFQVKNFFLIGEMFVTNFSTLAKEEARVWLWKFPSM